MTEITSTCKGILLQIERLTLDSSTELLQTGEKGTTHPKELSESAPISNVDDRRVRQ